MSTWGVAHGRATRSVALARSPAGDRAVTGIAGYFGVASIKFWLGLRDKRTSPINRTRNWQSLPGVVACQCHMSPFRLPLLMPWRSLKHLLRRLLLSAAVGSEECCSDKGRRKNQKHGDAATSCWFNWRRSVPPVIRFQVTVVDRS